MRPSGFSCPMENKSLQSVAVDAEHQAEDFGLAGALGVLGFFALLLGLFSSRWFKQQR